MFVFLVVLMFWMVCVVMLLNIRIRVWCCI